MKASPLPWTEEDLERFLDEDLAPERRAALAEALRTDGALRARLAAIIEADARVRAALLAEPVGLVASERRPRSLRLPLSACAAAAVALAALGAWLTLRPVAPASPAAPDSPAAKAQVAAHDVPGIGAADLLAAARSDGLLIAVVPNGERRERRERIAPPEPPPEPSEQLLALLDAGNLDSALAMMLDQPAGAGAESLWQAFGRRLYSGQAAQEVLLSLPAERQVEVCRAWSEEPSLRPVTFEWLARLGASEDPEIRGAVVSLRTELHERPELRAWLLSYAAAP